MKNMHKKFKIKYYMFISFLKDKKAVAATEFALLVPIMSFIWLGSAVLAESVNANRKATFFAYSVGDMIAQSTEVDHKLLDNIYDSSASILWPFKFEQITVSIVSIITDEKLRQYLSWASLIGDKVSWREDLSSYPKCYKIHGWARDSNTYQYSGNYIYIATQIVYAPTVSSILANNIMGGYFNNGKKIIEEKFYVRPRYTEIIKYQGNECKSNPYD